MRTLCCFLTVVVIVAPAGAQSRPDTLAKTESPEHTNVITGGVSTGVMHFGDGGHERAVSAALSAALPLGFSIGVNPTYAWAQAAPTPNTTTGVMVKAAPVQGVADLPVSLGYSHALPGPGSPGFYASLGVTLPTGDTAAVGSGQTAFGVNVGVWASIGDSWSLSAGAGHSLNNDYATGLGSIAPTTVSVGVSRELGRLTTNVGYSTEMGAMPAGTTHSQTISGGTSIPLFGQVALNVNGSVGRADGAQSWGMSVGIGTTFADVGQVSPYAAISQLVNALGKGRSLGKSRSAAAKAAMKGKKKG